MCYIELEGARHDPVSLLQCLIFDLFSLICKKPRNKAGKRKKLWKNTKKEATHCRYFSTFEDLRSAVLSAFEKYLGDASKVVCVMKKLRRQARFA
jgi:hypothetical protein